MDPYVNGKERVYVSGVVQSVSPTMRIRRKSDNDIVPKRDITFADKRKKTVVVSLWNDHATNVGQELLDNADKFPIVAIKSLKVGDFQGASMASIGSDISPSSKGGVRSMYYDRVSLSHVTSNPYLGEDKTCNKKVTGAIGSGYWCEGCQKNDDECSLRYIMVVKVSDASGEAWLSMFNEQAERILGALLMSLIS
ncbi:Replication protein A 70 kDa DNA-binding subunit B [Vitis vinifera]|uniref:Replication protein A 70 kDa DNA-binding subunit B n=1 Tax=Vitis vinifera TaxID=29760 RepID=A0A438G570_VITVI|nr:Replication protein A 70 kDa DNA-binding subunit B [Vitis vinifera]